MPSNENVNPIIEVRDFSYKYPRTFTPVLKNINLSISEGDFIGIVGPTGAGKTTLCLALAGVVPAVGGGKTEGSLKIAGNDSSTTPLEELLFVTDERKSWVGITLQDPEAQLVGMTVEEDLAFGVENLGLPQQDIWKRIDDVLKLTRLEEFRKVFPYKLSGGQKQRVAIGSTMTMLPHVLVFDEPTSELDPIGRSEVFSVIRELKEQENLAIVVVEHHTEELARFCDRIVVMKEGEIILEGDVSEVFMQTELLRQVGVRPPDGINMLAGLHAEGLINMPPGLIEENEIIEYLKKRLINGRKSG
jgi:energy-coupling factor transporter ATP-binding protein EcfA2